MACTLAATIGSWLLFRVRFRPEVAFLLGLALAIDWRWARDGSAIGSEPPFLLLGTLSLLLADRVAQSGRKSWGVALGMALGSAILTRHAGLAMAAAVLGDLLLRRKVAATAVAGMSMMLVVSPWVVWLAAVRERTQIGLVPRSGLLATIAENTLFYLRRMPDQWLGPVVEVATVFRPGWTIPATAFAGLVSGGIAVGWIRMLRTPRKRLLAMAPLATLALLLLWPFTEAGRFLVPIIPFLLAGLAEGLAAILAPIGRRRARGIAAGFVLIGAIPYSLYAILGHRADTSRLANAPFDAACAGSPRIATRSGRS